MNVFLTGASGYIGSAAARHLHACGWDVTGLTRDPAKAEAMARRGIRPVVGDLRRPGPWLDAAARADAVIHLAFEYGSGAAETDRAAVDALLDALASPLEPRLFVYTSGVWVLGDTGGAAADEMSRTRPPEPVAWRPLHESLVLAAAGGALDTAVVRPGCVYGENGGLYGEMFREAVEEHRITLPGDGSNRWAAVYLDDLAELYRLVLERRPARALYHATDGSRDATAETARAFLDAAGGGELEFAAGAEARRRFGRMSEALQLDQDVSSEHARRDLGWRPSMRSPAANAAALIEQWHERARTPVVC